MSSGSCAIHLRRRPRPVKKALRGWLKSELKERIGATGILREFDVSVPALTTPARLGGASRYISPSFTRLMSQSCKQNVTVLSEVRARSRRTSASEVCRLKLRNEPDRNMNDGLEQIGALTTAWLSLLFIAASVFGSICALGAAWAARWFVRRPTASTPSAWPDVSILKPLSGFEAQLSENIETYEPLAEFPEGEEFPVVLDCGRRRLRLALA